MRPSQNLPLPPRIYPLFQQLYATLPKSTTHPPPPPPYQNIPPFNNYVQPSQNLILLTRIYPTFQQIYIVWPSQNLPLPPWIYSPFNNYMRLSQNLPLPPSQNIYPHFQQQFYYATLPKIYPSLPEYTPLSTTVCDTTRNLRRPRGDIGRKKIMAISRTYAIMIPYVRNHYPVRTR